MYYIILLSHVMHRDIHHIIHHISYHISYIISYTSCHISYDIILQYCGQWPQNLRCQTAWYEMPPPWCTISEAYHIKRFGNVDFEAIAHNIVLWYHMIYDMMYILWCMISYDIWHDVYTMYDVWYHMIYDMMYMIYDMERH